MLDNTGATTLTPGQALTVSGTASSLDAMASGGSIGQPVARALQVAGETRLDAGSQAVRLTEATNKFGDLVRVTAGETVLHASDDLKVELRTGAATLTAGKALALRGAAASLEATAGDGAITQLSARRTARRWR